MIRNNGPGSHAAMLVSSTTSVEPSQRRLSHGHLHQSNHVNQPHHSHQDEERSLYGAPDDIDSTTEPAGDSNDERNNLSHMIPPPTPGGMVSSTTNIPSVVSNDEDDSALYEPHEDIDSTTEPGPVGHVAFSSPPQHDDHDVSYQDEHLVQAYYEQHSAAVAASSQQSMQLYLQQQANDQYQTPSYLHHHHQQVFQHHIDQETGHDLSSVESQQQAHYSQVLHQDYQDLQQVVVQNGSASNRRSRDIHEEMRVHDTDRAASQSMVLSNSDLATESRAVPRAVLPESYLSFADADDVMPTASTSQQQQQQLLETTKSYLSSPGKKFARSIESYLQPHSVPSSSQLYLPLSNHHHHHIVMSHSHHIGQDLSVQEQVEQTQQYSQGDQEVLAQHLQQHQDFSGVHSHDMHIQQERQQQDADDQDVLAHASAHEQQLSESLAVEEQTPQASGNSEIVINDVPVESRARASLPASYLYIEEIIPSNMHMLDIPEQVFGVFARKSIPQRTQFGPVEGVISQFSGSKPHSPQPNLIVFISDSLILDQSDENKSNWMRFVRTAISHDEQNLVLVTKEQTHPNPANDNELITTTKFYFMTTKPINAREELKVWYSREYAEKFRLKTFESEMIEVFATKSTLPNNHEQINEMAVALNSSDSKGTPACDLSTTGGHKLRNKIAKTQQQQLQLQKQLNEAPLALGEDSPNKSIMSNEDVNKSSPISLPVHPTQYKCETCGKSFPRFYSLRRHQVMHSGEKKFKCPICGMSFSHVYNRNRHVKRHSKLGNNRKPVQTVTKSSLDTTTKPKNQRSQDNSAGKGQENMAGGEIQGFTVAKKSDLPTPGLVVKKPNLAKPFRCQQCYKTFQSDERLAKHAIVHTSDEQGKPLACTFCEKRFLNNSALSCHLKIHSIPKDQPRRYDCVLCKEWFECTQTRKEHVLTHCDAAGHYSCPHCKKRFEEFSAIRKHVRAFHSDKQYPCTLCEKVFPRPDKLKLHMLRHSDHREFLCQNCGKQFKRKDKLKEHMQRMHAPDREAKILAKQAAKQAQQLSSNHKKFIPKVSPSDYQRFIYKCHSCLLGFKRRGMLVNHLAKRHPETPPETVPELNLPILKTTRDYYCQYCDKVYKSSSKRKAHILKNHPGKSLPLSNRHKGGVPQVVGHPNPTYSATVGSVTTHPHYCDWCHKQYASKAKLLQHQRKKHPERAQVINANIRRNRNMNISNGGQMNSASTSMLLENGNTAVSAEVKYEDHELVAVAQDVQSMANQHQSQLITNSMHDMSDQSTPVVSSSNLITILGNINNIIATVSSDSVTSADLQELLQANPSAANDLLTQAMSELTQNKNDNGDASAMIVNQEDGGTLWN